MKLASDTVARLVAVSRDLAALEPELATAETRFRATEPQNKAKWAEAHRALYDLQTAVEAKRKERESLCIVLAQNSGEIIAALELLELLRKLR